MVKWSRVLITTVFGLVFGIICMVLVRYEVGIAFWPMGVSNLVHHTVLGFTIGVSAWKMHWAAHGAIWGALFGTFTAIAAVGTINNPYTGGIGPLVNFVLTVVWGFLIETIATKGFKQAQ
jgi:hypothetical protein